MNCTTILRRSNNHIAEGRRTEYSVLRSEILHLDRACLIILGLLLTASGSIFGFTEQSSGYTLLNLLPPLWFIGWCYISEKRFMLRRTSRYLRHEVEDEEFGLGWQRWLGNTREQLAPLYPRFDPHLLETILTALVILAVPLYLFLEGHVALLSIGFIIDASVALIFSVMAVFIVPKYLHHHGPSDEIEVGSPPNTRLQRTTAR